MLFSLTPLVIFLLIKVTGSPTETFMGVFVINYFLIGLNRYIPDLQAGIVLDGLLTVTVLILIFKSMFQKVEWENGSTILTLVSLIWLIYCVFEIFNPNGVPMAWAKSIRGIAVYFFLISFLTPIFIPRFIDFKRMIFILSILTIIGAGKAMYQKFIGFDNAEFHWLYIDGGYTTHMLHYGTRYFSIFSDAGNFGAAMGFAFVLFSFTSLQAKSWQKFYFIGVALLSAYGMLLSGTRGAFFIPIVGFLLGIILLKHYLKIVIGLVTFGLFVGILFFSSLGEGN
ncbi:MAG: O-antigen ligase domain-containing protein, partial [Rikenellaceae bacterium]